MVYFSFLCCPFLLKLETVKYRFIYGLMKINSKYFIFTQIMQSAIRLFIECRWHRTAWVIQWKNKFSTLMQMQWEPSEREREKENLYVVLEIHSVDLLTHLLFFLQTILLQYASCTLKYFSISSCYFFFIRIWAAKGLQILRLVYSKR